MRWLLVLVAAGACSADPPAPPAPQIPAQQIQSIAFDGGRKLPVAALRSAISTRVGDLVDSARLDRDRDALEAELAASGYLAAKVSAADVTFVERAGASIVFDIELGPLFHLRSVVVTGPGRDADVVTLAAGDPAFQDRISRARQTLADGYARRGGGHVELIMTPDLPAAVVDVVLETK